MYVCVSETDRAYVAVFVSVISRSTDVDRPYALPVRRTSLHLGGRRIDATKRDATDSPFAVSGEQQAAVGGACADV